MPTEIRGRLSKVAHHGTYSSCISIYGLHFSTAYVNTDWRNFRERCTLWR